MARKTRTKSSRTARLPSSRAWGTIRPLRHGASVGSWRTKCAARPLLAILPWERRRRSWRCKLSCRTAYKWTTQGGDQTVQSVYNHLVSYYKVLTINEQMGIQQGQWTELLSVQIFVWRGSRNRIRSHMSHSSSSYKIWLFQIIA